MAIVNGEKMTYEQASKIIAERGKLASWFDSEENCLIIITL